MDIFNLKPKPMKAEIRNLFEKHDEFFGHDGLIDELDQLFESQLDEDRLGKALNEAEKLDRENTALKSQLEKVDTKNYSELIPDLDTIQKEMTDNIKRYGEMKETGNSQGDYKEFYYGKWEAYKRCQNLIDRFMRWHSMKEQKPNR